VTEHWDAAAAGVLRLPSGRLIRGRGLRHPLAPGPKPAYGVYLLGDPPPAFDWDHTWLRWRDFWLPSDDEETRKALHEAWQRAPTERVELACKGGLGRTGTALACIAILDGVPRDEAVAYVRRHYRPGAVETPWQKRYVRHFRA
jgi:hypothetical protein